MALFNLRQTAKTVLSVVEDAIQYAINLTGNRLYEFDFNSPARIIIEAQAYIYNQFLLRIDEAENAITLKLLDILGASLSPASYARTRLRFEINTENPPTENVYIRQGFPVRSTNGIIFITDTILMIPANTKVGFVNATATKAGNYGNVTPGSVTLPLQTINYPIKVTNPDQALEGRDGETVTDAQFRLAAMIRKSGLIDALSYVDFVRDFSPGAIVSVASLAPNTVDVWVLAANGSNFSTNQFSDLQSRLNQYRMIGLGSVRLNNIQVLPVYVEVIAAITSTIQADTAANEIRDILFTYLSPDNPKQSDGVIILNNLIRLAGIPRVDYIQDIQIGNDEGTAYGQNYVFNKNSQRVRINKLKVVLIYGQLVIERTFTR